MVNLETIKNRETLFTKIIKREIPSNIIYEDDKVIAFLDIFPFEKGHTLLVPKIPYKTIMEMPEEDYIYLQKILLKLTKHLEREFNSGINILQNNKKIAGQEIEHVHFHIIPRKENKKIYCSNNSVRYLNNEIENYMNKLKTKLD